MKNCILNDADTVELPAPYAVPSGGGALMSSTFGIAQRTLAQGEVGAFAMVGAFTMPKAAGQAFAVGDKVYWDDTARVMTAVAAGNKIVGGAIAAAAGADATAAVRLNGITA